MSRSDQHSAPLIAVQHLGRRRPNGDGWLLDDVQLTIAPGECVGFVGPVGAGKTLLLRALALLDPFDTGQILWQGGEVVPALVTAYRSQVMYLHQRPSLAPGSVEANLRLPFTLHIHQQQFDLERIVQWLSEFEKDRTFLSRDEKDLSGGERQIVALLRVLQLDPTVLLLDEPTTAMDAKSSAVVENWIANWLSNREAQRAAVWVSHDDQQIGRVTNRIYQVSQGCVVNSGASDAGQLS